MSRIDIWNLREEQPARPDLHRQKAIWGSSTVSNSPMSLVKVLVEDPMWRKSWLQATQPSCPSIFQKHPAPEAPLVLWRSGFYVVTGPQHVNTNKCCIVRTLNSPIDAQWHVRAHTPVYTGGSTDAQKCYSETSGKPFSVQQKKARDRCVASRAQPPLAPPSSHKVGTGFHGMFCNISLGAATDGWLVVLFQASPRLSPRNLPSHTLLEIRTTPTCAFFLGWIAASLSKVNLSSDVVLYSASVSYPQRFVRHIHPSCLVSQS
ncbi:hypothetical protein EX30DRAFT_221883 [Ascodesmis nigricans]|uniref:Uncharacterized protein n=1 Tax=Ascodesmis nigricans TaxID=341454 RepID=A0A4S2MZZ0_9PEZI|nr:hypothetical protein EX30DRAFT_221883 [Ascodesmis nigricans]